MSSQPITRALHFVALAGVACLSLIILPSCGGDDGDGVSLRGDLPPGTGTMPEEWPQLVSGMLPELKKNPTCAEALANVQDDPQALWQYWKTLLTDLQRAQLLPYITHYGISKKASDQQMRQAAIYRIFRNKLEEAIIRETKLNEQEAEHARKNLFPDVWNAFIQS